MNESDQSTVTLCDQSVCVCVCVCVSLSLFLSFSISFFLSFFLSLSISLSFYLYLSLSLSLSLSLLQLTNASQIRMHSEDIDRVKGQLLAAVSERSEVRLDSLPETDLLRKRFPVWFILTRCAAGGKDERD
jgi:predicted membrane metal-binding protein